MKRIFLLVGLCALANTASSKQLWNDNSISLLRGQDYTVPYQGIDGDEERTVVTFEHVSGHTWGDVFLFVDRLDSADDHNETYMELSPRLSLGKITSQPMTFGIISDVLVTSTVEWVSGPYPLGDFYYDATHYLIGPAVDLKLPGFTYFQVNAYHRDNDEGKQSNWQLTPVWGMPFSLGSAGFLYDGFIDWRSGTEDAHAETNFTSQLKWDAGKTLMNQEKTLYIGVEYVYWRNKFGLEDGTLPFETTEKNLNLLVKAHF